MCCQPLLPMLSCTTHVEQTAGRWLPRRRAFVHGLAVEYDQPGIAAVTNNVIESPICIVRLQRASRKDIHVEQPFCLTGSMARVWPLRMQPQCLLAMAMSVMARRTAKEYCRLPPNRVSSRTPE